jgi:hypothetical protein
LISYFFSIDSHLRPDSPSPLRHGDHRQGHGREQPLSAHVTWDAKAGVVKTSLGKWEIKTLAFTLV